VLPRTHGSALFTRGETQALAVATLGTARAALRSDNLSDEDDRHFYLQYFFPPSSVGEVRVTIHRVGRGEATRRISCAWLELWEVQKADVVRVCGEALVRKAGAALAPDHRPEHAEACRR